MCIFENKKFKMHNAVGSSAHMGSIHRCIYRMIFFRYSASPLKNALRIFCDLSLHNMYMNDLNSEESIPRLINNLVQRAALWRSLARPGAQFESDEGERKG